MLSIATWNVNSLRARLEHVLRWLEQKQPDILGIQETKLPDEEFPADAFQDAGYHAAFSGQKGYNGVALISRAPGADVVEELPGLDDDQRRVLAATYGPVRVVNLYVPNGQFVGSRKYDYKLSWLERLHDFLAEQLDSAPHLVVLGDFNIAPEDRDVYNPKLWEGRVLCSEPERAAFRELVDLGLCDAFRRFQESDGQYTWWDYRARAFQRNHGLRIDHILASEGLCEACEGCEVDREPRGWEKPSDHAPVVARFRV
jgi:exodeoxyribonuclease-3